jgi:hypothetical protein
MLLLQIIVFKCWASSRKPSPSTSAKTGTRRKSLLEQKDMVEDLLLQKISKVLKITVETFKNFHEEQVVSVITNTYSFRILKIMQLLLDLVITNLIQ